MENVTSVIDLLLQSNWTELWSQFRTESKTVIKSFIRSVDWSERWIHFLFITFIAWFGMIVKYRDSVSFQFFAFILDSLIVFGGRSLNSLGKKYWTYFSTKDYFDEDGMFYSFMISFPLLIITSIQIFILLMSVVKTNIQIQKLKALDRKHKELENLNKHIDKLEKETEDGLS